MKAEGFLSDDFLKQFKAGQQLNDFLGQMQKRAIEKMLEGELDGHWGYEKHEQSGGKNARNGYGKRRLRPVMDNQRSKCHVIGMPVLTQ